MKVFWGILSVIAIVGAAGFAKGWIDSESEAYEVRTKSWIGYAVFLVCFGVDAFVVLSYLIGRFI